MHFRVPVLAAGLTAAGLAVSACSGGSQDWYANGKSYSIASNKAQGGARLIGVTPQKWCTTDLDLGKQSLLGITLNGPPLSHRSAVNSWVSGCVAGYWATHQGQPRAGSTPLAAGSAGQSGQSWFTIGKEAALAARHANGMNSTYGGVTATSASAWCADLMFLPQPASLKAQLAGHLPAPGAETIQWVKGCEAGKSTQAGYYTSATLQDSVRAWLDRRLRDPANSIWTKPPAVAYVPGVTITSVSCLQNPGSNAYTCLSIASDPVLSGTYTIDVSADGMSWTRVRNDFRDPATLANSVEETLNQQLSDPASAGYDPGVQVISVACTYKSSAGNTLACHVHQPGGAAYTLRVDVSANGYSWKPEASSAATEPSASPAPRISLACKVLLVSGGEEFSVTTVGGGSYNGTVYIRFHDGSGDVFRDTTISGVTPIAAWKRVPASDMGASAEPSQCTASVS